MSHSLQFKILLPSTILFIVFFGTRPLLAESPHLQALQDLQPSSPSPQVVPAVVLPPTAASTGPTPLTPPVSPSPDPTTDNTSSPQDPAADSTAAPTPLPMEKSIYTDLTDLANAQARQEQARQQLSPLTPPTPVPPVPAPSLTPVVTSHSTPVTTAPIKIKPLMHAWSHIPFINDAGLSASAYSSTNGLSPQTTKMLTLASYAVIIIGIALVLIKPKNIAFLSPTFKKPISSI